MFYADFVLSKKGPLARIWLAAHWDRKLTKSQVFETNIEKSVDGILQPSVKMALRTSGHLLLGVVRIYSRKAKYLLADCNEAFVKIKMAFRPGMVDLPEDHREAAVSAVTLPEVFHDFDSSMPDFKYVWNDVDIEVQFAMNQSRADEITMREDFGNLPHLANEEHFGEVGFDADTTHTEMLRHADTFDQSLHQANLLFTENDSHDKDNAKISSSSDLMNIVDKMKDNYASDLQLSGGLFEGGLFDDTPMPDVPMIESDSRHDGELKSALPVASPKSLGQSPMRRENYSEDDYDDDVNDHFMPLSPGCASSGHSRSPSPMPITTAEVNQLTLSECVVPDVPPLQDVIPAQNTQLQVETGVEIQQQQEQLINNIDNKTNENVDQTTIIENDEGTFALLPVDASVIKGVTKSKRKRKLIVDDIKNISGEEMKAQLSDTTDIITTLDLAPPTKRLMHWKETGGVEKLFALPGKSIPSRALFKNYQRHLTSKTAPNEDVADDDHIDQENAKENVPPLEVIHEEEIIPPPAQRRGRKRKQLIEDDSLSTDPDVVSHQKQKKDAQEPFAPPPKRTASNELTIVVPDPLTIECHEMAVIEDEVILPQPMDIDIQPENDYIDNGEDNNNNINNTDNTNNDNGNNNNNNNAEDDDNNENNNDTMNLVESERVIKPVSPNISHTIDLHQKSDYQACNPNNVDCMDELKTDDNDVVEEKSCQWDDGYENPVTLAQNAVETENIGYDAFNANNLATAGGLTPWHDDYENPISVEPPIEQAENETNEQFEERILNKRANHLYQAIRMRVSCEAKTTFNDLIKGNSRKQVAQKFYSLLVLKKHKILELKQDSSYGEVVISSGSNFDDPSM